MRYPAKTTKEGKFLVAEFIDCPGCATEAKAEDELRANAQEALEGWLEAGMAEGELPPKPTKYPRLEKALWVPIPFKLAVKMEVRWARHAAGLTQAQLGERAGVSQQMVAKLEHPDYNPSAEVLDKVAAALGLNADFRLLRE